MLHVEFVYHSLGFSAAARRALYPGVAPFTAITSDSRKIQPGCLFVAIQGDQFDGHDFIAGAIEKGARGVICRRGTVIPPQKDLWIFAVEDTLQAYRKLAASWRREFSIPVVVVAGAVGKTSTKEILSAALRGKWPQVLRTQGSFNGFVGIPMTLLELRAEHGAAVIEVGIDEIGAMEQHMQIVGAQASVLTMIAPEHLEKLLDLPTVAREEGIALTSVAAAGGLVAINLDDPWIRPHAATLRTGKKVLYTLTAQAAPTSENTLVGKLLENGKQLEVHGLGTQAEVFDMPLPGKHNGANLLAAVAVAHGLGLTASEITQGLKTFAGAEGRSELKTLDPKTPVVCDYYNASPASMEAGFELLQDVARTHGSARRHACLGDMLELGTGEEGYHRGLAESLMRLGFEQILLYGTRMQWLHQELQNRGYSGLLSHHTAHDALAKTLLSSTHSGDAILIKGSRGMKMETVWKLVQQGWKP